MTTHERRKRGCLTAIALSFLPTVALAQAVPPAEVLSPGNSASTSSASAGHRAGPKPDVYTVSIQTRTPKTKLEIRSSETQEIVARCVERCVLDLTAGDYVARQDYGDGGRLRYVEFSVAESCEIEIEDARHTQALVGGLITALGAVSLGIGLTLTAIGLMDSTGETEPDEAKRNRTYGRYAIATLLTGAILLPVGLVTLIPAAQSKAHVTPASEVNVAVSPSPGGASVWLSGRF